MKTLNREKIVKIPILGNVIFSSGRTLLGVLLGLVAGGFLIALYGVNPFAAYGAILRGAFSSLASFTNVLVRSSPLLLGGIGRLQKSDPERVDAKKLRIRACGGLVAGALYLACRYLQL